MVGGGAAGFFAAIRAREVNPRLEVTILEAHSRPLGKVKISGGGRCNVTHHCFDAAQLVAYYPRGSAALRGVFSRFGPRETVAWFEARGVKIKTEADGRMFPVTDDSQTIIDCLLDTARRAGVRLETRRTVTALKRSAGGFELDGERADRVVLATGGTPTGHALAAMAGHTLVAPVPSLFTFKLKDPRIDGLAGVSVPWVKGRLEVDGERAVVQEGPLLVTHWGLSGPVVLRLSAWGARALHGAGYRAVLLLDLVPTLDFESIRERLLARKRAGDRKQIGTEPAVELPRRLWQRLVEGCDLDAQRPWREAQQKGLNRLAEMLKRARFEVAGKGQFKEEFVTAGGVPLREMDMKTMQSRLAPGLFVVGELLDVDALTGGFNFQNAWSTGWIAGEAAASEA